MKEIIIISGKGGTGKTVISASIVDLLSSRGVISVDCDVDAANLYLLLNPKVDTTHPFISGKEAMLNSETCISCGKCEALCRFGAISSDKDAVYTINPYLCEGCSVCANHCPAGAIKMEERNCGEWYESMTQYGAMFHARLYTGAENSGQMVTLLRKSARETAEKDGTKYVVVDGSPGIGCPVIASLTGADIALVVTEPTLSGEHDLARILDLLKNFSTKPTVCINKYDLNIERSNAIEEYCRGRGVDMIFRLPFDRQVVDAVVGNKPPARNAGNEFAAGIKEIVGELAKMLEG